MDKALTLDMLRTAMAGTAAAFRCVTECQPVGGPGDKIFPPTYEGGQYAVEKRRIDGQDVDCVLLDSVQSQANRMELALLDAWERKQIPLPVISVDFAEHNLPKPLRVTSLEAPHRIADALLRDSLLQGLPFRQSERGKRLDHVETRNATALFEMCPTALIFGMWDSTGPKGGMGAKFARAMVSEIVGLHAQVGVKTSSRIDPAAIVLSAGPLYQAKGGGWTLEEGEAVRDKKGPMKLGKDGKPSEANHGNVTPGITAGGVTISKAMQTTVLSLPSLRRLRFPIAGKVDAARDDAARVALAALGLCAAALVREQGCDLRSRCQLVPAGAIVWELIDEPGQPPKQFALPAKAVISLYAEAVKAAQAAGVPWMEEELQLKPSPQLVSLVQRSQSLAVNVTE